MDSAYFQYVCAVGPTVFLIILYQYKRYLYLADRSAVRYVAAPFAMKGHRINTPVVVKRLHSCIHCIV